MFFKQLKEIMSEKVNLTFTIHKKGEELTIAIFQNSDDEDQLEKVKPLSICGTAEEIDKEFFDIITKPIMRTAGIVSNVKEVTDSIEETEKEEAAPEPKKKEKVVIEKPSSIKARAKALAEEAQVKKEKAENSEALRLTREALVIDPACKLALKLLDYLEKWEKMNQKIESESLSLETKEEPVTDQNSAAKELQDVQEPVGEQSFQKHEKMIQELNKEEKEIEPTPIAEEDEF